MKKLYLIAFTLAMITTASAQFRGDMPVTTNIRDGKTGEIIGTSTRTGNTSYLRDKNGELTGTVAVDNNGVLTHYDPSGKITSTAIKSGNTIIYRDPDGKVIRTTTTENDGSFTARDPDGNIVSTGKTGTGKPNVK